MKDLDKKIVAALYPVFGMFLAFLVFTFGCGGWRYVFTGRRQSTLLGPLGLVLSLGIGAVLGWLSYHYRRREIGGLESLPLDDAERELLVKRIVVVATCFVGLYFVWQLAKSLR
jgi:TRAP-type C4-dicarboxylate transport system permease small subunit